jgi:hypothetical protein
MRASYVPVSYLMQIWGSHLKSKELIHNPSSKICELQALRITFYRFILSMDFSFKLGHLICEQLFEFGI